MRCLTTKEAENLFGQEGFSVKPALHLRRTTLVLRPDMASRQSRVGGRPPSDVGRLVDFLEAMNRWHSTYTHRLLWIDHWDDMFPSAYDLFVSARQGLGESRSLSEAPGHYFDPYPYDERDQTRISKEQARETGILIGLASLIIINGWDGWLIAGGSSDRIEFWEGNIFFYSNEKTHLANAESLMGQFDCSRDLA
ncbi:hypothetical protein [Hypericibacter adhaerens]|jgi:hypothetical protein|nr:hypothetical protein [Hypericibacter adhaerens]